MNPNEPSAEAARKAAAAGQASPGGEPSAVRVVDPSQLEPPRPVPASWHAPDPDAEATSPQKVYEAMLRYVGAGLSVIPIQAWDGSKAPDTDRLPRYLDPLTGRLAASWQVYRMRLPTADEILRWRSLGSGVFGVAIVCGAVSGGKPGYGLEVVDFDAADLGEAWKGNVERRCPGLVARLAHVTTPRPGCHFYFRCSHFGGNRKLAFGTEADAQGQQTPVGLIDLKGEGGYCVAPPSPRRCHPSNGLYRLAAGSPDLTQIPDITLAEREVLLEEARKFNTWVDERPHHTARTKPVPSLADRRPGDDFNRRAAWDQILLSHGWAKEAQNGEEVYWRRPGKESGPSATTNYRGSDLLHVFSTNAHPFEADESYDKFAAYCLLNHNGDFSAAASALREQGYGG